MQTFSEEVLDDAAQILATAATVRHFRMTVAQVRATLARFRGRGTEPAGEHDRVLAAISPVATPDEIASALIRRAAEVMAEDFVSNHEDK